jgi:hypothetical protein
VEKMEYSSHEDIDIFNEIYMCRNDVRRGYFLRRSVIYRNIAIEYQVSKMEKELEELSVFFEDKKNVSNLLAEINDKYGLNEDIIRILINKFL